MAYPVFYPFKSRMYETQSSSTSATASTVIAARGKYLGGFVTALSSSILTPVFDVLVNSVGIAGSTGISITSSTVANLGGGVVIPLPTTAFYVNPGDVLSVQTSTCLGGFSATHVVQEF